MWNPLKILMGMLTPYVEPPKPERIEPTIGESIPLTVEKFDYAKVVKEEPPMAFDKVMPLTSLASESVKRKAEAKRNYQNSGQRRSKKGRPTFLAVGHTSYGHDDGGSSSCSSSSSDSGGGGCSGGGGGE